MMHDNGETGMFNASQCAIQYNGDDAGQWGHTGQWGDAGPNTFIRNFEPSHVSYSEKLISKSGSCSY